MRAIKKVITKMGQQTECIELKFKPISYKMRLMSILNFWELFLLAIPIVFTFVPNAPWYLLLTFWILFGSKYVYFAIITYRESQLYIYKIEINVKGESLILHYSIRDISNNRLQLDFDKIKFKVYNNGVGISAMHSWKIQFIKDKKVVFTQYSFGDWTPSKLLEVEKLLKRVTTQYKTKQQF